MTLKRITCPSCGSSRFDHDSEGNLICSHCGVKFGSPRETLICPTCKTENPPQAKRCMGCGAALGKTCPVCNHPNAPGDDHCYHCGAPLDTLAAVSTRYGVVKSLTENIRHQHRVQSKASGVRFMDEQRARLDAEERERAAFIAEQQFKAQRQQKTLIVIITLLGIVFVGALVLSVVIFSTMP